MGLTQRCGTCEDGAATYCAVCIEDVQAEVTAAKAEAVLWEKTANDALGEMYAYARVLEEAGVRTGAAQLRARAEALDPTVGQ